MAATPLRAAGLRTALAGTLWVIGLVIVFSVPVGVGAAIYLEEYAPDNRFTRLVEVNIRNLAGVPSIVYGILGLFLFVRLLRFGETILAGQTPERPLGPLELHPQRPLGEGLLVHAPHHRLRTLSRRRLLRLTAAAEAIDRTLVEASGAVSNDAGKAARIEVEPTLIGVVEAGGVGSDGRFKVLGQTVQIVPASTEQAATLLIDTPAAGDLVEVHATRSGTGASLVYLATRVERRVAPARTDFLRLTGITEAATSSTFRIGGTTVSYTGTAIGTGQLVTVFAGTGDYSTTSATTSALTARAVRVRALASTTGREDYEGGVIGSVTGNVLVIDGVQVNIAGAAKSPSDYSPTAGDYVRVRGSFRSGVFFATELKRRRGDDVDISELKGSLSGLQLASTTVTGFKVRDTAVTVPGGVTVSGTCRNGTFVEVKGRITATGIQATRVDCKDVEVLGAVVERKGYVKGLDRLTSTFDVVATLGGTDTVARVKYQPDTTFFRLIDRLDATSWKDGILVEVEGPLASDPTAAIASFEKTLKIKLENTSP